MRDLLHEFQAPGLAVGRVVRVLHRESVRQQRVLGVERRG